MFDAVHFVRTRNSYMKTFEKSYTLFCVWERGRKESEKKQVTGYTPCNAGVIKKCTGHSAKVSEQNRGRRQGVGRGKEEEEERKCGRTGSTVCGKSPIASRGPRENHRYENVRCRKRAYFFQQMARSEVRDYVTTRMKDEG